MDSYKSLGYDLYLAHHGVKGMKWGVRRYQPYGEGGYTPKGKGGVTDKKSPKVTSGKIPKKSGAYTVSDASDKDLTPEHAQVLQDLSTKMMPKLKAASKKLDDMYKKHGMSIFENEELFDEYEKIENEMGDVYDSITKDIGSNLKNLEYVGFGSGSDNTSFQFYNKSNNKDFMVIFNDNGTVDLYEEDW